MDKSQMMMKAKEMTAMMSSTMMSEAEMKVMMSKMEGMMSMMSGKVKMKVVKGDNGKYSMMRS